MKDKNIMKEGWVSSKDICTNNQKPDYESIGLMCTVCHKHAFKSKPTNKKILTNIRLFGDCTKGETHTLEFDAI